jgi:hypothetical protein
MVTKNGWSCFKKIIAVCEVNAMEVWKDVVGNKDYQVSNYGRVRSNKKHHEGKILKSNIDRNGYEYVMLYKNKKAKLHLVHRLVAEAFIENPENKTQVNHIDFNKANNYVENLEWSTPKENVVHSRRANRLNIETSKRSKLNFSKARQAIEMYRNGISQTHIAKLFGVDSSTISRTVRGERWRHESTFQQGY